MFVGNIIAFIGSTIPEGYLNCDGSAVSRSEYQELFNVIGTTYGSGDGSSTFNVPNLMGRVALCTSSAHSTGTTGGEVYHELSSTETPTHSHIIPEHTHGNNIAAKTPELSHNVAQPLLSYPKISTASNKFASGSSGQIRTTSSTSASMTSNGDITVADHPATACTVTGGVLDCPTFNTESTGGGVAHNNMMPYLAVKYLIKAYNPVPIEPGMALFNGCCVISAGGGYITGKTRN